MVVRPHAGSLSERLVAAARERELALEIRDGLTVLGQVAVAVHGVLSGGSVFDLTLTRYGYLRSGSCVVYRATVRGTASLAFPS